MILVTGATGNQGGAVVDALLAHPERWRVRALTRNPARADELTVPRVAEVLRAAGRSGR